MTKPIPLRVLVVDDNEDSCTLFQTVLADEGHHVDIAFTGDEGLQRLVAGAYDVAIIDIGLPGIDGYELARRARETLADKTPRLVALTGYTRQSDREHATNAGFSRHLTKPIDIHAFVDAVTNA